jgi:hypothetical protein
VLECTVQLPELFGIDRASSGLARLKKRWARSRSIAAVSVSSASYPLARTLGLACVAYPDRSCRTPKTTDFEQNPSESKKFHDWFAAGRRRASHLQESWFPDASPDSRAGGPARGHGRRRGVDPRLIRAPFVAPPKAATFTAANGLSFMQRSPLAILPPSTDCFNQCLASNQPAPGGLAVDGPVTDRPLMSPNHPVKHLRGRTKFIQFSASDPSSGQVTPCSFALLRPSILGHNSAFTGKLPKFLRGTHWQFSLIVRLDFNEAPLERKIALTSEGVQEYL